MDEVTEWVRQSSAEQWSAIGTMVTAIVAIAAAIFAWQQVQHARRLREEQAQPFVVVSLRPSPVWSNAIDFVIENIGNTIARNVTLSFDPQLKSASRTLDINDSDLIKHGIRTMPPGMRIETLFDLSHERFQSDLPMTYTATVSYEGIGSKRETVQYVLDLNLFYGLEKLVEYGMHHAAKSLDEMAKTLKKWNAGGLGRLKVSVSDEDYRDWSYKWQRDRGGRWPSLGRHYPAGRPAPSKFGHLREPFLIRLYWAIKLPLQQRATLRAERQEDERLAKAGRADLVAARRAARGEA